MINGQKGLIYTFSSFSGLSTTIRIDKRWGEYIRNNAAFLKGWYKFSLVSYLQRRNPAVPGILDKISPPEERNPTHIASFYKDIMEVAPQHEIYHNIILEKNDISIDHFILWSYTASDKFRNLTPTTKSINSSKGNFLPLWDKYFPKLSEMEYSLYTIIISYPTLRGKFESLAPKYFSSIETKEKLFGRKNLSKDMFANTLKEIMEPQYKACGNCGFGYWDGS